MKKMKRLTLVWLLSLGSLYYAMAQNVPTKVSLTLPAVSGKTLRQSQTIDLPLPGAKQLKGEINYNQSPESGKQNVVGSIEGISGSSFYLRANGTALEGNIILKESKKAYSYFSNTAGTYVKEVNIESVLCVEYQAATVKSSVAPSLIGSTPTSLKLQSLPGAAACVLLDFDGQYVAGTPWNNGQPINALPSGFTEAEIRETFDLVKEDFLPFNINITTDSNVFFTYPQASRMRAIITPTSDAAPGWGGVAYIGSFKWDDDTPCWIFNLGAKNAGETVSHEIGHTLGLLHDGRNGHAGAAHEEYFSGQGSWAPIMGASFSPVVTQWSKGEYPFANLQEDDLAIIAGYTNAFGYRNDDHGDNIANATALRKDASGNVRPENNHGIIGKRGDRDYFSFTTSVGGNIMLYIQPAARHANLNIRAELYNASGMPMSNSNNTGLTSFINSGGPAGTYYVMVEAVGEGSAQVDGYSDYASLGAYSIYGNVSGAASDIFAANLYRECNYTGTPTSVPVFEGSFTTYGMQEFIMADDAVSSLKVKPGYKVELYEYDNYNGTSISFTADDNCLIDNNFDNKTSSFRVFPAGNRLPQVTLASPANHAILYAPTAITFKANPSDEDGTISKVEFYNGVTKVGESTSAPYQFDWAIVPAGTYTLTAVVTDNAGGTSTSTAATVTVTTYTAQATVYPDCNYGGTAVGLAPGYYTRTALNQKGITDNDIASLQVNSGYEVILYKGDFANEEAKRITANTTCLASSGFENTVSSLVVKAVSANKLPDVTLTSPRDGMDLTGVAGMALYAYTHDEDGYVSHVEFYNGSTLIATGYYPGYYAFWTIPVGTHTLTAKAFDNDNGFTISNPVTVTKTGSVCTTPAWLSNTAYVGGNTVEQGGIKYLANWWNYNQSPSLNNGPSGSGQPWTSLGTCNSRTGESDTQTSAATTAASLLVYPNPTNGSFTIQAESEANAQVFNSQGLQVADLLLTSGKNEIHLVLPAGIYLVKHKNQTTKLVIE
ncbi:MAG: peptidase domain protein [Cytophagaceae bacterium]|jgi:hypothetical protein|nr:peptidase domain protein [Cytophagaceae bacterium]